MLDDLYESASSYKKNPILVCGQVASVAVFLDASLFLSLEGMIRNPKHLVYTDTERPVGN